MNLQQIIMKLHTYWAEHGCTIWQPHSEKVGAGTMNPATVLRVLGPEPWNIAYVEPSYRPADGRYAENPNRMQMHTQYQVILKPDPGNPQELYLSSLEAIGLERTRHDIRFVEDNWESPALGAWGLGWEVWLDGQEITQFTYFQQAGGQTLDPVSVELTYGLERIAMYLQEKTEVWHIDYDGVHTYDEIFRCQEIDYCIYNFEVADIERQRQLYEQYRAEAEICIKKGLVIPAHDYVLRQSHTFNLLDARGAIGVTERAKFFADMRNQARLVAELYLQQRQQEQHPWLNRCRTTENSQNKNNDVEDLESSYPTDIRESQNFLLELGCEELPPQDVVDGIQQIQDRLADLLESQRLDYQDIKVTGTPRRLVVYIRGLSPRQTDLMVEKKGPPINRAFSADDIPQEAAIAFARSQGVNVSELKLQDNYVYAVKYQAGKPTIEILPELLANLLDSLHWRKAMRWNTSNKSYPRPLRWIVALYGHTVVPFSWAGVHSGRTSRGSRFTDADAQLGFGKFTEFEVHDSDSYEDVIKAQKVVLDRNERRQKIIGLLTEAVKEIGGTVLEDEELLNEVTDLVESPFALLGSFDERYLKLPKPVLVAVMKKHQRYFPVISRGTGKLLPCFIAIANSESLACPEVVKSGYEDVIRARYADADFFYQQDTSIPLDNYIPKLATLSFHDKLGSMLDKVERLKKLAPQIAESLGAFPAEIDTVARASALSKSDLVTTMVIEMTSLQGTMGEIYALKNNEPIAVGQAIREHYLPRFAGDSVPSSLPGLALSLADKLDSLVGLFSIGLRPSGSTDPFGLRRIALGIINSLIAAEVSFDIHDALVEASRLQQVSINNQIQDEAKSFLKGRLRNVLLDKGFTQNIVEAVLAEQSTNPVSVYKAVQELNTWSTRSEFQALVSAYTRSVRMVQQIGQRYPVDPEYITEKPTEQLYEAYLSVQKQFDCGAEIHDLITAMLKLVKPINRFFDEVLVMHENKTLRESRLGLLQCISELPDGIVDITRLTEM